MRGFSPGAPDPVRLGLTRPGGFVPAPRPLSTADACVGHA